MRSRTAAPTAAFVALCTSACLASAASAENAFTEYLDATRAHFLTGLNSVVTVPADPVMGLAEPPEEYAAIPGIVPGHILGALQGVVMGVYRGSMGALDMLFAPLPIAILSPEPRYKPIPGFEWDE